MGYCYSCTTAWSFRFSLELFCAYLWVFLTWGQFYHQLRSKGGTWVHVSPLPRRYSWKFFQSIISLLCWIFMYFFSWIFSIIMSPASGGFTPRPLLGLWTWIPDSLFCPHSIFLATPLFILVSFLHIFVYFVCLFWVWLSVIWLPGKTHLWYWPVMCWAGRKTIPVLTYHTLSFMLD